MTGSTLFRHARLVGYPDGRTHSVLVRDGVVVSIEKGEVSLAADEERDLKGAVPFFHAVAVDTDPLTRRST